jgi:hypothetical protein
MHKFLEPENEKKLKKETKKSGRMRWTDNEKRIVLEHFKQHIKRKVTPKKDECEELRQKN